MLTYRWVQILTQWYKIEKIVPNCWIEKRRNSWVKPLPKWGLKNKLPRSCVKREHSWQLGQFLSRAVVLFFFSICCVKYELLCLVNFYSTTDVLGFTQLPTMFSFDLGVAFQYYPTLVKLFEVQATFISKAIYPKVLPTFFFLKLVVDLISRNLGSLTHFCSAFPIFWPILNKKSATLVKFDIKMGFPTHFQSQ